MSAGLTIAGRRIGPSDPPYIVAEVSANHNGSIERIYAILEAAKAAGADAAKIQTYTADTLTIDHDGPDFQIAEGLWRGRTLYDLYSEASTPWDWHHGIFRKAEQIGLPIFSSPFDESAVEFLEELDSPAYKIASFEAVDLELIASAARTGKPVIISTGLATRLEIAEAVATVRENGGAGPILLHCVSAYPAPPEDMNLRSIPALASEFETEVGLSDHTLGTGIAASAVALGATMIEKHLTLRRADGGPDAAFSLEPSEFADLVQQVRTTWAALGSSGVERAGSERSNLAFRRSLYVVADIMRGETLTRANVRSIRPGYGLPPKFVGEVLGRKAKIDILRGTALDWSFVE
ncbi:pseudaminic acid synthase [Methylobacterium sp. PvR107]|uniref:pseudaminic acid synthase n=1 Tax=Methylobacterium sp. PvR107 TaxID=2806597 RepID=UPI001AE2E75B|nr:pseudaminic acid synthase [Methylobacterium sp. PvR107]MBP1178517.1 N-acetylneuraminate synthase [Methylobacterium sp. PvR107]